MQSNRSTPITLRIGALIFGLLFASLGLLVVLTVLGYLPAKQPFALSAKIMTGLGAGTFVFAGFGMMLFGIGAKGFAATAAGLSLLFFLLTFNWIAFGPGERNFTRTTQSSVTATTTSKASETEGRLVFGIVAGLMDLLLVYGVLKLVRHKP